MKILLLIPPTHAFHHCRIYIWGLLAMISAREYYEYLTNQTCKRLGMNVYISHLILFVEWSITYKFRGGMFQEEFPDHVKYFWGGVLVVMLGITSHLIVKDVLGLLSKDKKEVIDIINPAVEIEYPNISKSGKSKES